jgi:hypothetical protein
MAWVIGNQQVETPANPGALSDVLTNSSNGSWPPLEFARRANCSVWMDRRSRTGDPTTAE